jgi:tetratricopeptide repeat protein
MGSVARHLGLLCATLGRLDDAEHHYEHALEIETRWDANVWRAHAHCELASVLLARGRPRDRARAKTLLGEGRALAREFGMRPLARLADELRATGLASGTSLRQQSQAGRL